MLTKNWQALLTKMLKLTTNWIWPNNVNDIGQGHLLSICIADIKFRKLSLTVSYLLSKCNWRSLFFDDCFGHQDALLICLDVHLQCFISLEYETGHYDFCPWQNRSWSLNCSRLLAHIARYIADRTLACVAVIIS